MMKLLMRPLVLVFLLVSLQAKASDDGAAVLNFFKQWYQSLEHPFEDDIFGPIIQSSLNQEGFKQEFKERYTQAPTECGLDETPEASHYKGTLRLTFPVPEGQSSTFLKLSDKAMFDKYQTNPSVKESRHESGVVDYYVSGNVEQHEFNVNITSYKDYRDRGIYLWYTFLAKKMPYTFEQLDDFEGKRFISYVLLPYITGWFLYARDNRQVQTAPETPGRYWRTAPVHMPSVILTACQQLFERKSKSISQSWNALFLTLNEQKGAVRVVNDGTAYEASVLDFAAIEKVMKQCGSLLIGRPMEECLEYQTRILGCLRSLNCQEMYKKWQVEFLFKSQADSTRETQRQGVADLFVRSLRVLPNFAHRSHQVRRLLKNHFDVFRTVLKTKEKEGDSYQNWLQEFQQLSDAEQQNSAQLLLQAYDTIQMMSPAEERPKMKANHFKPDIIKQQVPPAAKSWGCVDDVMSVNPITRVLMARTGDQFYPKLNWHDDAIVIDFGQNSDLVQGCLSDIERMSIKATACTSMLTVYNAKSLGPQQLYNLKLLRWKYYFLQMQMQRQPDEAFFIFLKSFTEKMIQSLNHASEVLGSPKPGIFQKKSKVVNVREQGGVSDYFKALKKAFYNKSASYILMSAEDNCQAITLMLDMCGAHNSHLIEDEFVRFVSDKTLDPSIEGWAAYWYAHLYYKGKLNHLLGGPEKAKENSQWLRSFALRVVRSPAAARADYNKDSFVEDLRKSVSEALEILNNIRF